MTEEFIKDEDLVEEQNVQKDDKRLKKFAEQAASIGIYLSDRQLEQFLIFYHALVEKNKVMNLTAITDFEEVLSKHFLDSLLIAKHVDFSKVENVLDMGTGAGFPGIPLKIAFPEIHFTLTDSLNKRILFLQDAIEVCGLEKIDTIHARAEELGRNKDYREKYDLVVSRAVANLSTLSEYCIPFVKKDGIFVSYKSAAVKEEYEESGKAIRILGGKCDGPVMDYIPGTDLERSFIIIQKVKNTPLSYPRKAGIPSKKPLGHES